MSELLGAED